MRMSFCRSIAFFCTGINWALGSKCIGSISVKLCFMLCLVLFSPNGICMWHQEEWVSTMSWSYTLLNGRNFPEMMVDLQRYLLAVKKQSRFWELQWKCSVDWNEGSHRKTIWCVLLFLIRNSLLSEWLLVNHFGSGRICDVLAQNNCKWAGRLLALRKCQMLRYHFSWNLWLLQALTQCLAGFSIYVDIAGVCAESIKTEIAATTALHFSCVPGS